jgi:hypothetical protein
MTGNKIICFTATMLATLFMNTAKGQKASYSLVMGEIGKVRKNFKADSGAYVSCRVNYYYSMESTPLQYIDSLAGLFKLAGEAQYNKIGNTETVRNDSATVVVYNDDNTIMAGPSTADKAVAHELFVDNLDSAFVDCNSDSLTIVTRSGLTTLSFYFNDSSRYYNGTLVYDAASYIPQRLSYILRSSKAAETGEAPRDGALITILFSGYSHKAFDTSTLNINKYLRIGPDGKAKPQAAYSRYNLVQTGNFRVNDD